jgi:two-component system, cell cycle response regulator
MRMLIADDDSISLHILHTTLTTHGHEVIAVKDGNEALRALSAPNHPKLAILDWNMPGVDGVEVIRRLRRQAETASCYLIILTAREDRKDLIEALSAGADDYVSKPWDHQELLARIGVGRRVVDLQTVLENRLRELDAANDAIARLASRDELTGLANRRSFNQRMSGEISVTRRHHYPLCLIMADLDHFKNVNDTYGHDVGDRVLKAFADLLVKSTRLEDLPARWGGEEFAIILPHTATEGAHRVADRIRVSFEEGHVTGVDGHLSASFGVTEFREADTSDSFIQRADRALRVAKETGRNRVSISDDHP